MHFRDVLKFVVQVVVVELQRTDGLNLLGAIQIDAQRHDLLLMLDATVLFSLVCCHHGFILLSNIL